MTAADVQLISIEIASLPGVLGLASVRIGGAIEINHLQIVRERGRGLAVRLPQAAIRISRRASWRFHPIKVQPEVWERISETILAHWRKDNSRKERKNNGNIRIDS